MKWKTILKHDPIPVLLDCGYENVVYFTKQDLLDQKVEDVRVLWELKSAKRILNKQQPDGRWKYPNPNKKVRNTTGYDILETFRQLGLLIEKYGLDKRNKSIQKAKDFLFKYQSDEGDIRGIYWNQYSPNYTAGMLELLIKAGYTNDPQIKKGQKWLLSIRQDDGGWAIPIRTKKKNLSEWIEEKEPVQPDKSKPFSYMVTGVVLRAFAYHPDYQKNKVIKNAAELVL